MKIEHFTWKPEYDLGIKDIDDQHHYFVGLINKFIAEFRETSNAEYKKMLISELNAYARFHFISEENIMFRSQYPNYMQHKAHHHDLLDQLSAKAGMLELESTERRKDEVVEYLVGWFLNHTNKEDRLFAEYLRNNNNGE